MICRRTGLGLICGLLTTLATTWVGCAEKGLVRDFSIPADRRTALDSAEPAEQTLRVPDDTPFNITDKASRQTPGMYGTARGESGAEGDGTAFCGATVGNGGSAGATFHLGHCVQNRDEDSLSVEAVFTCEYEITARQSDGPDQATAASYQMELFVNDSDGRLLKRVPIDSSSADGGPTGGTSRVVKEVYARLEPGRAYNFVLAASVEAKTGAGGQAELDIEVKSLHLKTHYRRLHPDPEHLERLPYIAEPADSATPDQH